jgi:hypothetical protein
MYEWKLYVLVENACFNIKNHCSTSSAEFLEFGELSTDTY